MTDTKPGPCPYPDCEGRDSTMVKKALYGHYVKCDGCGALGPVRDTPAEAIAAWNAPGEKIERLEALIKVPNELVKLHRQIRDHYGAKKVSNIHDLVDEFNRESGDFVADLILAQQKGGNK